MPVASTDSRGGRKCLLGSVSLCADFFFRLHIVLILSIAMRLMSLLSYLFC